MNDSERVAIESGYFDSIAESEGEFNPFRPEAWRKLRAMFEAAARPAPQMSLLDVGCGSGESFQLYRRLTRSYAGLDLSLALLAVAAKHRIDRLAGDACSLPIEDSSVDIVAFSSVLHHIPDFPAAVREAARVVKPGGVVFAFDPNLLHPAMALLRHPRSPLYSSKGVSPLERPLRARELRSAFAAAGLTSIQVKGVAGLPYRRTALGAVNAVLPIYNLFDRLLDFSGLGRWFGPFIVTVARRPERTR